MVDKELKKRAYNFFNIHGQKENLDQVFLVDIDVIAKLISAAKINKTDRVMEIGAGLGSITKEISKIAKKVYAVEIDKRFRSYLFNFPRNIEFFFEDVRNLLNDKTFLKRTVPPKKIIANIPYGQIQAILLSFTKSKWYNNDFVFIAPLSIIDKINNDKTLHKYFFAKLIEKMSPQSFYPIPNTFPAIVYITRKK